MLPIGDAISGLLRPSGSPETHPTRSPRPRLRRPLRAATRPPGVHRGLDRAKAFQHRGDEVEEVALEDLPDTFRPVPDNRRQVAVEELENSVSTGYVRTSTTASGGQEVIHRHDVDQDLVRAAARALRDLRYAGLPASTERATESVRELLED